MRATKLTVFILTCSIVAVFFIGLGSCPLTEQSEARYGEVAWEMFRTGDYLTPRYNGITHFHKPPLFYWCIALAMKILGNSEFSTRIPTTLAALLTLLLTARLAVHGFKETKTTAFLSACFLGTSPFFWEMGRVAVTDMLVTLFTVVSLMAGWELLQGSKRQWDHALFWGALGLSFLTKGPVGPFLVALIVGVYGISQKKSWRAFRPLPGLVLAAALGLPWYLWAVKSYPGLLSYFLGFQTVDRIFTTVHHRTGPLWFYIPVIVAGFLPWSLLLLAGCKKLEWSRLKSGPDLYLILWVVLPTVLFSLLGSKLPPYVLPVFPALALLTARHVSELSFSQLRWPLKALGVLGLVAGGLVVFSPVPRLQVYAGALGSAALLLLTVALTDLVLGSKLERHVFIPTALCTMLGFLTIAGLAYEKLAYQTAAPLSQAILKQGKQHYEVAMYRRYLFGLPYYLHHRVVHVGHPRETQFESAQTFEKYLYDDLPQYLKQFRKGDEDRFLVLGRPEWEQNSRLFYEEVIFSGPEYVVLLHPKA